MILSALLLGLTPTIFFQEPKETELEAAQRKVAELEAELGPEHLDLAEPLFTVMMLYYGKGQYGKAETACRQKLTIQEKAPGPEHPDVATSLNNLADLLEKQGSYADARLFYERALNKILLHLSKNLGAMAETERFQYLATKDGPEPLLLNLVAMQGSGPPKE